MNTVFIPCIILAVLFGIVVGVFGMYFYFMRVILPHTGKTLQQTNMPKKFAHHALHSYWAQVNDFADNLNLSDRVRFKTLNNKVLSLLTAYVEDPKNFVEEKQDGQKTV
jgi:hypothetical protein